jgi:hypothetical protein
MKAAIKILLFALMAGSIISISYWAAFDAGWWKPIVQGSFDEGRGMILFMLHMAAILGFPLYCNLRKM